MWFISADGLTSCRGSMTCMREGLIRRFIFEVRLSGPFECLFCRYFRLIIGIPEWRHHLQIANMLLPRSPRGTCRCGQKNDWLCICHYLGFLLWGVRPPSTALLLVVLLLLLLLFNCYSILYLLVFLLERRHLTRRLEEDQEEGKILITFENKKEANILLHRNLASIWRPPLGVSEARF